MLIHSPGLSVVFKAHHITGDNKVSVRSRHTAHVFACPDTLQCLIDLVGDFQMSSDRTPSSADQQEVSSTEQTLPEGNVMPLSNSLSLPSDDVLRATVSEHRERAAEPVSNVEGETIQIVDPSGIKIVGNWLQARRPKLEKNEPSLPCLKIQVEIRDVTLSLYQGYDFERTRQHVKNAVKATRKRLEKIKQLLAEGQVPEQTMEELADPLLQSVFLPQRIVRVRTESNSSNASLAEEVDIVDRIVAFDDELDREDDADADTFLTWEKVSDRPPGPSRTPSNTTRTATSRMQRPSLLKRPRNSAIDVHLSGLEVCTRSLPHPANVASKIRITIRELSIVDNIRTSTWNKFLTELRPRDGGITRPTGSPMVRVILKMLRSSSFTPTVAADLSVRITPLRLHIDQDALDFLKAFFAFKAEIAGDASGTAAQRKEYSLEQATETHEGFVQRVEIHAVKIKLDYKPKRVDYYALRQGRAIEMMNFFHFEGSEMVLRHLVLTGVPSWEKVGDMLQEIWTPDVKANQLADFLAGINPIRSVVNVGHGVAELVLLPVAQYKKDGKLARGVQRGSTKFVKSTAMEAIKLGARLATGTQVILEHAEYVLGGRIEASVTAQANPGASSTPHDTSQSQWILTTNDEVDDEVSQFIETERTNHSRYAQQPEDVKEGLQTAYKSLSGNVRSAAETILAVPMEVYERSNDVSDPFAD
jgi:autophagy-related protein 2